MIKINQIHFRCEFVNRHKVPCSHKATHELADDKDYSKKFGKYCLAHAEMKLREIENNVQTST